MSGYITNIEIEANQNAAFRRVLYTDARLQLVVMSLQPQEDIGEEVHELDQFIRIESGEGESVLDGAVAPLQRGTVVLVPAGVRHNIINTSQTAPMKLSTLYAPPEHAPLTVHETKADALMAEER